MVLDQAFPTLMPPQAKEGENKIQIGLAPFTMKSPSRINVERGLQSSSVDVPQFLANKHDNAGCGNGVLSDACSF